MAGDTFFKIGDIKGEAQDAKHKDEIEVMSWSWGVAQPGSMSVGGGGGAGKASFSDLTNLLKACASGKHIPEATITSRKAGEGQQEYLIVKLTDVIITNVSSGGSGGDVMENGAMQFAKMELEYKPQKPDGSLDAGVFFKYDLKQNKTY